MKDYTTQEKVAEYLKDKNETLMHQLPGRFKRSKKLSYKQRLSESFRDLRLAVTAKIYLRKCNSVKKHARTLKRPYIENMGRIEIGKNFNLNSRNVQSDLVTGPEGLIRIGNDVNINFGTSIVARKLVKIGDHVRIGNYSLIFDSNMHVQGSRFAWAPGEPILIEDDVWIAARSIILKGSLIGRGSIIAAGSVVSGIIPPYVVAGGVPARIIRFLTPSNDLKALNRYQKEEISIPDSLVWQVNRVFKKIFDLKQPLRLSESPHNIPEWVPANHFKLIRELENEFDINIPDRDIAKLNTFEKICRYILKKNGNEKKYPRSIDI